jgi:hypothetical protein
LNLIPDAAFLDEDDTQRGTERNVGFLPQAFAASECAFVNASEMTFEFTSVDAHDAEA